MGRFATVTRLRSGHPRGGRFAWATMLVFVLSLLLDSLVVGVGSDHAAAAETITADLCGDSHALRVIAGSGDGSTPSSSHVCADCCVLCFSALTSHCAGASSALVLADAATRIVSVPADVHVTGKRQALRGNPRGPPAFV